jgi:hypothetical protein
MVFVLIGSVDTLDLLKAGSEDFKPLLIRVKL